MEGLTRALAVELAPIRVNIVSPGVVKTPLWSSLPETDRNALYNQMEQAFWSATSANQRKSPRPDCI
jgi:NAD(P)-dependent dehydrogenase (short-subunit alcohol dehydrogenase family)